MSHICTVLCVDDEPNILLALERLLHRSGMRVLTAIGGAPALEIMEREPVDVLLSDMRMPGMDGVQLLAIAKERWPTTVRLLLTGHADQEATVRAINGGNVFGYLSKPWDNDLLLTTVARAAELAHLTREKVRLEALTRWQNEELRSLNSELESRVERRTAELALANGKLKRSYMTSIKVFSNLIEQRSGQLVGHGRRVAELARRIALAMGADDEQVQRVFVAGLLHDIGLIGMPDVVLQQPAPTLDTEQFSLYRMHSALGEQALMAIDDLQPVATLIRSHHERYDGMGFPDALANDAIPLGARILSVADAYDELLSGTGGGPVRKLSEVMALMKRRRGTQFDPKVVNTLLDLLQMPEPRKPELPMAVGWDQLQPGMALAADLMTREGVLLLAADLVLTRDVIGRIADYAVREGLPVELQIKPPQMAMA